MRTNRLFITAIHRACLVFFVFAGCVTRAGAQSAAPVALPEKIAELERLISRYEDNAKRKKPDTQTEMQQLLAMAKLAALYAQSGRIQESWPLAEKILVRLEKIYGPDHPNGACSRGFGSPSYWRTAGGPNMIAPAGLDNSLACSVADWISSDANRFFRPSERSRACV